MVPQLPSPVLYPIDWVKMSSDSTVSIQSQMSNPKQYTQRRHSSMHRRSTSSHNFSPSTLPPSMPTTLPSLAYYSLNRNMNRNNLGSLNQNMHQSTHVNGAIQNPYYHTYHKMPKNNLNMYNNRANNIDENEYNPTKDWLENTTVTETSSQFSDGSALIGYTSDSGCKTFLRKYYMKIILGFLYLVTILSPVIMIVLPQLELMDLKHSQLKCEVGCEGLRISFVFRLIILAVGSWAVFHRHPHASLPRIHLKRTFILSLLVIFSFAFWFMYGPRFMEDIRTIKYEEVVQYSSSFLNSLLCLHYLALILLELDSSLQPQYLLHIVRSPDGESRSIKIGQLSIQEAAEAALTCYYTQFSVCSTDRGEANGMTKNTSNNGGLKKKAQLITATEEAFAQLIRVSKDSQKGPSLYLESYEAAREIFTNIAQPLQKYLKITNQQTRHTMDSIIKHLAKTIRFGMAPKAFLEKYLTVNSLLQSSFFMSAIENWSLSSTTYLPYSIEHGGKFKLRQGEVVLLCSIVSVPLLNISQEVVDTAHGMFAFQGSRESPV